MNKQNVTNPGTITLQAGELDNRNIGGRVSFSSDGEWVVATLAAVRHTEDGVVIHVEHVPDEEWVLDEDEPISITQPLVERFLFDIRQAMRAVEQASRSQVVAARG